MQLNGFWADIKEEMILDAKALSYMPQEVVNQVGIYHDSVSGVLTSVKDELELDMQAMQYFPSEIGKSSAEIIQPSAEVVQKNLTAPLNSTKWIILGALGIYGLYLISPAVKKTVHKFAK